jgi:tetratricopeptide (TPR) repeat protein
VNSKEVSPSKAELMVYEDSVNVFHLVWKFFIFPLEQGGEWLVVVDAHNGKILEKFNAVFDYVNGKGRVFDPDPVTYLNDATLTDQNDADYAALQPAYKDNTTLNELNASVGGLYYVRGRYAWSMDARPPYDAVSTAVHPDSFRYKRNQNGFEEVNIYYFIDKQRRYVGGLGFSPTWDYLGSNSQTIAFDARGYDPSFGERNAVYYSEEEYMIFGVPASYVDAGEDQSVILHEYGHAFHDALIIGGIEYAIPSSDTRGISEGIGDYLGVGYRRTTQSDPFQPNKRMNWFYPEAGESILSPSNAQYPTHWGPSQYQKMNVWASTLMDMEYQVATNPTQGTRLGRDITTKLMLTSVSYLTVRASALDNVYAIFQADRDIPEYDGAHLGILASVFDSRGFFYDDKVSGTIASNTTWSRYKLVTGDVTVNSGVTLTISPGAFIFFSAGTKLTVNGALNAVGTSTSRITFDRSGTSGTWAGLTFNGGLSGGTIKYAHISHADKGIFYQCGGPNLIEYTEIDFCNYGIYQPQCSGSDDKNFSNNSVHNNMTGFWFDNIWNPDLFDNHVYDNGYGVYSLGSDADPGLHWNTLKNNSSAGLSVCDGGWAYLNNNVVSDNWVGVDCRQYAGASLGTSSSPGYNKFSNNYDYDVWASSSCPDIYAIMNCWLSGVNVWHQGPGQIYTTPTWNCSGLGKAAVAVSGAEITGSTTNDDPVVLEHDRRGQALMAEEKYQEALEEFQFVLDNYPTAEVAKTSLHLLYRCYKKSGTRQAGLSSIGLIAQKHEAIELGGHAAKLMVYELVRERRYQEALETIERIRSRFPNTELEEVLLFRAGVIYRYFVNDNSRANEVFGELVGRYPDGGLADFARLELGVSPKSRRKKAEPKTEQTGKSLLPQAFVLEQNYPNPFNPVTEIRFGVPRQSVAMLEVFNILGQVVKTLVDEIKEAGYYRVSWDGRNSNGVLMPSGMYFYRLTTNQFSDTKRMLVMR